jgi:hypothetical protein
MGEEPTKMQKELELLDALDAPTKTEKKLELHRHRQADAATPSPSPSPMPTSTPIPKVVDRREIGDELFWLQRRKADCKLPTRVSLVPSQSSGSGSAGARVLPVVKARPSRPLVKARPSKRARHQTGEVIDLTAD